MSMRFTFEWEIGCKQAKKVTRIKQISHTYTVYMVKDELLSCCFLRELQQLDLSGMSVGEDVVKETLIISKSRAF